ncbi:MAG: type II toxin-antitoxin system VapC family toxin [Actinobacteria bacterium]|nr:type II toxin-antitoxin system VapC family toxin [Actinomycetota bacterium]MBU1943287.1 type II toxin-antitoxin system VapC family toxin [Actinomycetota bacterium]MBU2688964.1 type II toxin-antitoxin system VapC family toxin [Actinomycetota bacterium]
MELFVDTSALVKLYYSEPDSDQVEEWILGATRVFISELSRVEFASALAKKVRIGEIDAETCLEIWNSFRDDLESTQLEVLSLLEEDYAQAIELLLEFGASDNLRTLDSLQLAAALREPQSLFLSSDIILARMAEKVGLRLAP